MTKRRRTKLVHERRYRSVAVTRSNAFERTWVPQRLGSRIAARFKGVGLKGELRELRSQAAKAATLDR